MTRRGKILNNAIGARVGVTLVLHYVQKLQVVTRLTPDSTPQRTFTLRTVGHRERYRPHERCRLEITDTLNISLYEANRLALP